MGFFNDTPEEIAAKKALEFAYSPAGQAQNAKNAGSQIFQIALPLSSTSGFISVPSSSARAATTPNITVLDSIEAEGWRLEQSAYVYKITGSDTSNKLVFSGQTGSFDGEIIGIYIFRRKGSK